jgi:hypothetical protein
LVESDCRVGEPQTPAHHLSGEAAQVLTRGDKPRPAVFARSGCLMRVLNKDVLAEGLRPRLFLFVGASELGDYGEVFEGGGVAFDVSVGG